MAHNAVKNRVRLKICDIECTVSTEDQEDYVRTLGFDVQRTIQGLMGQNGRVSLAMAATIAALSYCDELHKEISSSDNLRAQIKQYCDEAMQAKEELERLQIENEKLRTDLDELSAQRSRLRIQLDAADSVMQAKSQFGGQEESLPSMQDVDEPVEEAAPAGLSGDVPQDEAQEPQMIQLDTKPRPIPRPIPPQAPLRRNPDAQPVQVGPYSRPKSPFEPDLPSADGFVSFFEKK